MNINTTENKEHISEIKKNTITIKEHFRAVHSTIPFKSLPVQMLLEIILSVCYYLIISPTKLGHHILIHCKIY